MGDHFIILEAGQTHTGDSKPFNFDKQRFEKYSSKPIYETIDTVDELFDVIPSLDPISYLSMNRNGQNSIDITCKAIIMYDGAKKMLVITPVDEIISDKAFSDLNIIFSEKIGGYQTKSFGPMLGLHKLNLFKDVQ